MFDDLTNKEKGFADDFDLDLKSNSKDIKLIVKHNFYVSTKHIDEFLFIPTGSSLKFIKCTSSSMPYYELKTYVIYLEMQGKEIILKGSQVINSKADLSLRNCTSEIRHNKPYLGLYDPLKWEEVFVQSFKSIVKV